MRFQKDRYYIYLYVQTRSFSENNFNDIDIYKWVAISIITMIRIRPCISMDHYFWLFKEISTLVA